MPDAENPMSHRPGDAPPCHRAFPRCAALFACAALALLACGPSDPVAEARALLEEGRLGEAIPLLQAEIEARPGDPDLYYLYGGALLADGKPSLATWPLRRAARDPELAVEAGMLLARALLNGGSAHDAVPVAGEILALDPDRVEALALRAQARLRALDEEGALEDIGQLLELGYGADPRDLSLLRAKLEAELKLERADAAAQTIEELLARSAEGEELSVDYIARLCALRAVFTDERGEVEAAEEHHEGCVSEYPAVYIVVSGRSRRRRRTSRSGSSWPAGCATWSAPTRRKACFASTRSASTRRPRGRPSPIISSSWRISRERRGRSSARCSCRRVAASTREAWRTFPTLRSSPTGTSWSRSAVTSACRS
jgi:tetratricopeptide (TPR) repeat protein